MELRRVDPRILKENPRNPRKIQPGEMSDAALAASIGAIGILQPPVVSERNGELTIAYGARRVRIAITIGLPEIDVLVKDPDDHDHMRAVSENVVRAPVLGSVSQLSCWVRTVVAAAGDIHGHNEEGAQTSGSSVPAAKRGQGLTRRRHHKLSKGVQAMSCTPATWRTGEREGNPSHSEEKSAPKALRSR